MSYKVLEQNGIDNENVDGGAFNRFTAGGRDGVIEGVFSECALATVGNGISIATGLIIACGVRVKIFNPETLYLSGSPMITTQYQIILQLSLFSNGDLFVSIFLRPFGGLQQDALYKLGQGIYEVEIGTFTHNSNGTITDLKRTLEVINGSGELQHNLGMFLSVDDLKIRYPKARENDYAYIAGGNIWIWENNKWIDSGEPVPGVVPGKDGVSPTIEIDECVTLPAGAEATVENVGTNQAVKLKFGIPQGEEGAIGPEGAPGEQGKTGEPGAPGEKGERGFSGYIQCIGIAGTGDWSNHVLVQTSIDGNKGNQAGNYCLILDDNNASLNGSVVLLGVNDTGSNYYPYTVAGSLKGAKGDKGDTGANGEKGEPGEKGIKKFINSRYGFGKSELQSAATEGATYTWDILPSELEGVTVGDNVVIKVGVSDLGNSFNSYAFVFAKVTALNSGAQNLTTVSYGYVSTGEKGDIGPKGDKGDTGATGDPGATYSLNGSVLTIRFN